MTGGTALLLPSFAIGGAERVVLNLASGLAARGEQVRIVVLDGRGPLRDEVDRGVEVIDLGRRRARTALPALVRTLRRIRPEAILSSATHLSVLLAAIRPLLPRPIRLVFRAPSLPHPDDDNATARAVVGWALRRSDAAIASSPPMRERLIRITGGRTTVQEIPNPVDVDGLRAAAAAGARSTDAAETTDAVTAIVVGRLVPGKGHADLLTALADDRSGDVSLDVLGDGPLHEELQRTTGALGLDRRVRFHGRIADRTTLARLIAGSDLLVQPARFEGMPNSVLEALALGTPVLATTDLEMLAALSGELEDGALRLVDRASLAEALGSVRRRSGPVPRPSLLPSRFQTDAVVGSVLELLHPGRNS